MKSKLFLSLLGLILACDFLMSGCASTSTSTLYDTPNWMPDGRIICNKLVVTTSQQLYGGGISESHGYITAFWPSGTGEVHLFEDGGGQITCSPTGEMIAYIASWYDLDGNYIDDGLRISNFQGNKINVPHTSHVRYLDWSPDATKLVYSDTSRNLYVINRDGSGKTKIATSAEAVAWRVGEKIVYEDSNYNRIYSQNFNSISKEVITVIAQKPQITQISRVVYKGYGNQIESIRIDGSDKQILFYNYQPYTLKLSFDNTKIVSGAWGDPGIWLINIDGTGYTKIR